MTDSTLLAGLYAAAVQAAAVVVLVFVVVALLGARATLSHPRESTPPSSRAHRG